MRLSQSLRDSRTIGYPFLKLLIELFWTDIAEKCGKGVYYEFCSDFHMAVVLFRETEVFVFEFRETKGFEELPNSDNLVYVTALLLFGAYC